jgi:glycerol-3-phosphate dehydrogenase (NAD(P)+)
MRIAVLGAGAWGTAIAGALAPRARVVLWARDPDAARVLAQDRRNDRYLPGIILPQQLAVTADLAQALAHARGGSGPGLVLLATPTSALRGVAGALRAATGGADDEAGFVCAWLCKGFERDSGLLPHEVFALLAPGIHAGPLSGPSFADEVARGLPTALVVAGEPALCARVTQAVHGGNLRVYSSDDVIGVEVGGAVKNVLAIATGIADAMRLGNNARAALVTRGLSETRRLGAALGARAETFMGLAGLGDLLLTCTGDLSRNRRVGLALGGGATLEAAMAAIGHVAEGVWSAPSVLARAQAAGIEMPITATVCDVLAQRCSPRDAVERLLARDPRPEQA